MAHPTSTLATLSASWCLSVTLYQLPTCHQHPLCFTPLCVLFFSLLSFAWYLATSSLIGLFLSFSSIAPCISWLLFLSLFFPSKHSSSFSILPVYSNWPSLKLSSASYPLPSSSQLSSLVSVLWLDSIAVCGLSPTGQSRCKGRWGCVWVCVCEGYIFY